MKTRILRTLTPAVGLVACLLLPQTAFSFYNPSEGRWLSRDPSEEAGFNEKSWEVVDLGYVKQDTDALGVYLFVYNQPVGLVDLLGLDTYGKLRCGKRCYPCVPPAATTMYRTDTVPPSRPHKPFKGTHTHHYIVHQSPVTARKPCFCEPKETSVTGGATPAPGEIPQQVVGGGGVEYFYLVDEL